MKKYALTIQYIGKNYSGSQIQSGSKDDKDCDKKRNQAKSEAPKTIQHEIEIALYTLLKKKIKTIFSGRTDKGVNAEAQVIHFEFDKQIVASRFINSMNGLLPKDISVSKLVEVLPEFHAQKSARKRYYQYSFLNREQRSAFDGDLMRYRGDLNIERMRKALSYLVGEHDFSSFESSGSAVKNKICFIYKAECKKLGDTVIIDIEGSRFLYNMVRIIVGTLLLIEKENLSPETMKKILEAKDRSKAGKTVNPYGLTLMKIEYS